jgi:pimeloyl-ACP methyl ester carboxylesterase
MNRALVVLGIVAFATAVTAVACSSRNASSVQGDTPWEPCPSGFHDECMSMMMPLDYAAPNGPKVPVFLSRARSFTPSHADLWLLQGGPGDSADVFETMVDEIRKDVPGVDVYTMEQRGIGQSARLGCPVQESPTSDEGTTISHAEVPACLAAVEAQWPKGLDDFRLTPTANDLASAIDRTRTPGHSVFVYGVSYGTAVAIRYMQLRPNDATGVILDSIAPPGIAFFSQFSGQYDPVLHSLADLCAADPGCAGHLGPDPWGALSKVTGEVADGGCSAANLTRTSLSEYLETMLQSDELRVPGMALLHRVDRCSPADVAAIQAYEQYADAVSGSSSPRTSKVLYWNVVSSDLWESPPPSLDTLNARCDALSICGRGSVDNGEVQAMWPSFPVDPLSAQPAIATGSAVLLLNGTLDPQTPLANAMAFNERLQSPHKTFVPLSYSAHATINQAIAANPAEPPCGYQILVSFLGNPNAPDTSCASALLPVSFVSDPTQAHALFGADDIWGDEAGANEAGANEAGANDATIASDAEASDGD